IVIGLYIAIEGTLVSVFEFLLNERWTSVSRYLAIIAVAFLFKPIHDALYMLTDRTINPRRQRYRQRLQQVSDSLTSLMELDDLGEKMVSSLSDALETPVVALFVVSESADRRVVQPLAVRGLKETNLGDLALKIPFLLDELEKGAVISRRMLLKKVPHRPYLAQLDVLEAVLLIPILSERTLSGFIALGEHSAGADYSAAARELLQALARHAAVAIENARAYQKIAGLNEQLQSQIEKIEKQREQILVLQERLLEENVQLKEVISKPFAAGSIIGSSPSIREVLKMVEKVAATDSAVLLIGESGTGKELFAQALHENSNRRDKPFIKVNCAALAESLLESELFGHEKGSFTGAHQRKLGRFELAHGGTLFLDEIGELSSNLQAKLLRALQEKEFDRVGGTKSIKVDVRIIAATNRNLEAEVQRGGFREDLYYRLNVIRIIITPLRDRHRDIIDLAMHFLNQSNKKTGKRIRHIEERALDALLAYDWPGNVRELENLIERAVVLSDGPALGLHDFPIEIADALDHPTHPGPPNLQSPNNHPTAAPAEAPLPEILENMERETLLRALQDCQGNKSEAARRLGLARSTFFNKLRKFGLA
ncbi:MAG: sigma-54-dependent Fis family transcriptional regulator, partial [Myxococcales bacterium]|nr:sigma-54-dependent Fis family transcriptional regulator [Myxococcales bacterium]